MKTTSSIIIKLNCGLTVELKTTSNADFIDLPFFDFYCGIETKYNNIKLIGQALIELHNMGFKSLGMNIQKGYYDTIEDVTLNLIKRHEK